MMMVKEHQTGKLKGWEVYENELGRLLAEASKRIGIHYEQSANIPGLAKRQHDLIRSLK